MVGFYCVLCRCVVVLEKLFLATCGFQVLIVLALFETPWYCCFADDLGV